MESGCYRGFFPKAQELLLRNLRITESDILPWRVFTDYDFQMATPKSLPKGTSNIYKDTNLAFIPERSNDIQVTSNLLHFHLCIHINEFFVLEPGKEYDRKVGIGKKMNQSSINALLVKLKPKLETRRVIVKVLKSRAQPNNRNHRYNVAQNQSINNAK
jgi:hypothetical protein